MNRLNRARIAAWMQLDAVQRCLHPGLRDDAIAWALLIASIGCGLVGIAESFATHPAWMGVSAIAGVAFGVYAARRDR